MPNICFTHYALKGPTKDIEEIHDIMTRLADLPESLLENGWGKTWLGNLVKELRADPEKVYCRGEWLDVSKEECDADGNCTLRFRTETAWRRMDEVEVLIQEKYPAVALYFFEEESGNGIFQTNDENGIFFPEQYSIDNEEDGMDYYTLEKALELLSVLFGKEVHTWNNALVLAKERNDKADEDGTENHLWLRQAKIAA